VASLEGTLVSEFTPRMIAAWLRRYRDWQAEIQAPGRIGGLRLGQIPGSGGDAEGGPTALEGGRRADLSGRCLTVEAWLAELTPLERLAADHWLADDDMTITDVAMAMGVEFRQARHLVRSVPLLIWGHLYRPPVAPLDT